MDAAARRQFRRLPSQTRRATRSVPPPGALWYPREGRTDPSVAELLEEDPLLQAVAGIVQHYEVDGTVHRHVDPPDERYS